MRSTVSHSSRRTRRSTLRRHRLAARFPVILFQHGYTGLPSSHTALMEDLASHGWAVLNSIHPYEATAAMLADGTVVTFTDEKNAMRPASWTC